MKKIYNIWMLMCFLALSSCYEEETIIPTHSGNTGRFEFPQGNNSWDNEIVEIYEKFGVRLIYKDIIDKDFTKSWTGGDGGLYATFYGTGCINDEMVQFYVRFMQEHVFQYINPQITEKVFPMYWYLTYDFYSVLSFMPLPTAQLNHSAATFLDAWLTCFWGTEHTDPKYGGISDPVSAWKSPVSGNKDSYTKRRYDILSCILTGAIDRGNIVIPEEFDTGFDHGTRLVTGDTEKDKANPNHYLNRGYPGAINSTSLDYAKPSSLAPNAKTTFLNYMGLSLRLTSAEREALFPSADYPFIKGKFDYIQRYMKEQYNIDLEKIANGPENWEITPYPAFASPTPNE